MSYLSKTLGVRVNGNCSKSGCGTADYIKTSPCGGGRQNVIANFNTKELSRE